MLSSESSVLMVMYFEYFADIVVSAGEILVMDRVPRINCFMAN